MQHDGTQLWGQVTEEIRKRVRPQQYDMWFRKVRLAEQSSAEQILLEVPSEFWRDWLRSHYLAQIEESVRAVAGEHVEIGFVVNMALAHEGEKRPGKKNHPATDERGKTAPECGQKEKREGNLGEGLNARYTFDNFVVGPSNRFAHAAAMAVAEATKNSFNPLFIYGAIGMGKTHLAQAICHASLDARPKTRVVYMPCEEFLNDYVIALKTRAMDSFRRKYRQADLLVIDGIHFLANKAQSQGEFFHTFNALYNANRQIILLSDSAPKTIPVIEGGLTSRFSSGLVTKIDAPAYETRAAIIRKKAALYGGCISEDVVELMAAASEGNIRDLEGRVIRIIGFASLTGRKVDRRLAEEVLEENPTGAGPISLDAVMGAVTEAYGVRASDLQSKSRTRAFVRPRHVCMYLARRLTDHSLEEIGRHLGGRDHSTVVYAREKVESEMKKDKGFRRAVQELVNSLSRE